MARYIDADKFKYSLELSINSWSRDFNSKAPTITTTYKEVLHRLENMKTADVVEVETIKAWLCEIAINNVGCDGDFSKACEEIIARLDGLRNFAKERSEET